MKNTKQSGSGQIDTLIGAKTRIEGDVHFQGGLHVDGVVKGAIIADQDDAQLSISDQGTVEGEIRVPRVVIDGVLVGDIVSAAEVELAAQARVTGSIQYKSIEMALGAQVTGTVTYQSSKADDSRNVTKLDSAAGAKSEGATSSKS